MSHAFYNMKWQTAMEELAEQIEIENPPPRLDERGREIKEEKITWEDAFQHYACLYIRYIQIYRKLEDCYDQVVHPQKRRDVKVALEVVMARLCQVKSELVKFGFEGQQSDFVNLDEYLLDLKLVPVDLELPIPRYFQIPNRDDDEENKKRDLVEKCLDEHGGFPGNVEEQSPTAIIPKITKEQAIRIIQKNERGRQGAVRARLMKELRDEEIIRKRLAESGKGERDATTAATTIQKSVRGFVARRKVRRMAEDELVFVGMAFPSEKDHGGKASKYDPVTKEQAIRRNRINRQAENELKYIEALGELRQSAKESEGPEMKDQMWDDRFNWWIKQKELTGKYPTGFDGYYKELAAAAAGEPQEEPEEKKGKAAKEKKPAEKKGKGNEDEASSMIVIQPSQLVNNMLECVHKYRTVWSNLDESENYYQTHDEEIAREKLRPEIAEKIRKEVDIRLLAYLDNIKMKVLSKGKKTKGGKKKGKKKKGGKKKGKKAKKYDGEKACQHMPLVDMVSVLVKMGILYELRRPVKTLDEFIGSMNYLGSAYQAANISLDPTMAQMRACLTENFILPQGSPYVKENSPLVNTLLLYGPPGSGKTHLAKAICSQSGSTWFDLSPRNIMNKLGTKSEIAKLVHMVFKTAQELQPSVIYIDEVERVFAKSGKKGGGKNSEIGRLKQVIMQHKSMLTKNNRVLVVGNSRIPYDSKVDTKDLNKFFGLKNAGKMFFTPCPGYSTRYDLWKKFIGETGLDVAELMKSNKFDLDTLAYVSEGYTAGSIQRTVLTVLPERRVEKIREHYRSFDSSEFIGALSKTDYTYRDDYDDFREFTEEVSGEAARKKATAASKKAAEEASTASKGKGKR
jgi:SpoVK/Ycf46/Vps4 family AAA+-type ATPase